MAAEKALDTWNFRAVSACWAPKHSALVTVAPNVLWQRRSLPPIREFIVCASMFFARVANAGCIGDRLFGCPSTMRFFAFRFFCYCCKRFLCGSLLCHLAVMSSPHLMSFLMHVCVCVCMAFSNDNCFVL